MSSKPTLDIEALLRADSGFDERTGLAVTHTDTGVFHPIRESIGYAANLVKEHGARALPYAERIISRALQAQERHAGHIHEGGFKWMDEDQGVTDLNAVQFALERLAPFLADYGEQLSPAFRHQLTEAIRLGAAEIARLDVDVWYTNIALLDILDTILAGQVLDDAALMARGRAKLDRWIAFTNRSGAVPEYNSPTYAPVDINALTRLVERAADEHTRVKAQVMLERLWLHTVLHYHDGTAQLAGPHSRAYHNDVTGGVCGIKRLLYGVLADQRLARRSAYATQRQGSGDLQAAPDAPQPPRYMRHLLTDKPLPFMVRETADAAAGLDLTTYMTQVYALGSASTHNNAQNDRVLLYYRVPEPRNVGVLFSRYIVNEKTFGSHFHATDRSMANNLNEEGMYWGVQAENAVIALYALEPQVAPVHSLKTEVYLLDAGALEAVWVNDEQVEISAGTLVLSPLDTVYVADGDTYIALRPLMPDNLGYEAPIQLAVRAGELVLSIYNYYQGEAKHFWEYARLAGPFYKRNIRAGFVLEVGDRGQFGDFGAFRAHIRQAAVEDRLDGTVRTVRYSNGAASLEIQVDLRANRVLERRIQGHSYQPPMLQSAVAVQGVSGTLACGSASLVYGQGIAAWLVADDAARCWAAANPSDSVSHWAFETPVAELSTPAWGFGRVAVYGDEQPHIEIVATERPAALEIACATRPRVAWNGVDVSAQLIHQQGRTYILPALASYAASEKGVHQ